MALAPRCLAVGSTAKTARVGSQAGWGEAHAPQAAAAAPARRRALTCRAAPAAAPPAVHERAAVAGGHSATPVPQPPSDAVGTYPVPSCWLAYSKRLAGPPIGQIDVALERLRRQLGWGGRWAWQHEAEEQEDEQEDWEAVEEAAAASSSDEQDKQQEAGSVVAVLSGRGNGRRSGSGRRCRGRALAGAAAYRGARPWARVDNLLPEQLQAHPVGELLSAEQETWLGQLVQAAQQAQQEQQEQQQPCPATLAVWSTKQQQQEQRQQELVLQRGMAAQQLLFAANQRLVLHARRKLLGGTQLTAASHEELCHAGREALWRAAAGYSPARSTRFSTYAVPAIMNAMRDALAEQRQQPVHVPRQAKALAAQVHGAAADLAQQAPAQQHSTRQQAAGAQPRLEQLAAAAQLPTRQVLQGLAAGRPQRVASLESPVPVESAAGASRCNEQQQLAPFGDVQEEEEDVQLLSAAAAAQEVVVSVLSQVHLSRYRRVLQLRFGLADAAIEAARSGSCLADAAVAAGAAPAGQEVDFTTVGKALGVSRQRAQQLYHQAIASARQTAAAAAGLL